jgi:hypothetical protein
MMMTDYNDGKWHGWNGGDCPVHPQSAVEVVYVPRNGLGSSILGASFAYDRVWDRRIADYLDMVAFRVTKPYVEPPNAREIWINEYPGMLTACLHKSADAARDGLGNTIGKTTRWIEVLE